ncbi:MAG: PilZ domain-containing protein [Planctomycetota bacterium]
MQFNPHLGLSRFIGRREGRRIPGRLPQELLLCNLGPVLDLSAGGMRVLSTRPQAGSLDVALQGADLSLTLRAKVAWVHRLGFRRHEIGLTFLEVDEDTAQLLSRISNNHRARRVG